MHPDTRNLETPFQNPDGLFRAIRSGDPRAFAFFYDLHYHAMWSYAFGIVDEEAVASDMVITSFEKLWERRATMTSLKHLIGYLNVAVRNASLGHLKAARVRKKYGESVVYLNRQQPIDNGDAALARAELLQLALLEARNLPPKMREVFMMLYRDGFEPGEVASELGLSVNTVIAHRRAAVLKLREKLLRFSLLVAVFFFF